MTLIAAYREFKAPILIGDLLITRNGIPAGASKKLHIIRSNLALSWTGSQIAAELVVGRLHRELSAIPSHRELELHLTESSERHNERGVARSRLV